MLFFIPFFLYFRKSDSWQELLIDNQEEAKSKDDKKAE